VAGLAGLLLFGLLGWPARAAERADTEARLVRHLKFLAGEGCEGRGITTKGINLAAEYIAREFQAAGLKPGGRDGTFFQPFSLTNGGKLGKNCRLSLRGPLGQVITLEQGKHFTVSLFGSSGKVEAPLVFAGYGITSTQPKYDDYAGLDAAGKVVVVLSGAPLGGNRHASVFPVTGGPATLPSSIQVKLANARAHKAAAVLLVNNRLALSRLRDALPRPRLTVRDGEPSLLPVAHVRRDWIDRTLVATTGADLAGVEKDIDADLKPRSRALVGWSCRLETEVVHNRITVKNVIGVLEGSGPLAKETVVIGAHYDHIGFGSNMRRGIGGVAGPGAPGGVGFPFSEMGASAIHHGADDNASGTTAVMELARRFGAGKNRSGRRLVFMAFTAEESGLIGSRYYCDHPLFPLADTIAMINMDMIGRLQDDRLLVGGVGTAKEFPALLDRLNRKHHFHLLREMSGQGPSDHSSFYAHNIPVFFFFTGFHEQYHRPTDRFETINVAGLRRVAGLVEDVVNELNAVQKRPAFTKNSAGFARDKTLWATAPSVGVMPDYGHKGEGVLLAGVVRGTPAARAGLKQGDRIVAVSGKPVKDAVTFLALARTLPMGQKVELTVVRDGKPQRMALQLARPRRPADRRFGFTMDFTDTKGGLLLTEVPENSPAAKAGLKKGDRIVAVGGQPVSGVADYLTALRDVAAGEKVKLTVSRGGKEQTFEVQTAAPTERRPGRAGPTSGRGRGPSGPQ
jgi:hypothetical protein